MLLETVLLTLLVSTLPLTMAMVSPVLTNILILYLLLTAFYYFGHSQGRVGFMIWIWAIYFTFPGTYSTQPAVTTQVNRVFLKVTKNILVSCYNIEKEQNLQFICLNNYNHDSNGPNDVVRHLVTSMAAPSMASSSQVTLSTTCWWGLLAGFSFKPITFLHYTLLLTNHRTVLGTGGWVGFFLVLATFGFMAFLITCVFPGKIFRTYLRSPT